MILLGKLFTERLEENELDRFITFPHERILLGVREHYVFLVFRILKILATAVFALIILTVITAFLLQSVFISIFTAFLVAFTGFNFILQDIVHWYFHMYIITTRKILEVKYHPLVSETTNSVLLDQIKCTEIDAEVYGFIPELLDMGNVKITFDRPTHQEEFALRSIRSPRKVANILARDLNGQFAETKQEPDKQRIWYKDRLTNKLKFMEQNYGYTIN